MWGEPTALQRSASRALTATLEILFLSALAHVMVGGGLPATGYVLALGALVFAGSLLTLTRILRIPVVLGVVATAQLGLHVGFTQTTQEMHAAAHPDGTMLTAHAVATVLTVLVLLLQAQAANRISAWFDRLLDLFVPASVGLLRQQVAHQLRRCRRRLILAVAPRRGPPLGFLLPS